MYILLGIFVMAFGWLFADYLKYILVALLLAVSSAGINEKLQQTFTGILSMHKSSWFSASLLSLGFLSFFFVPLIYFITHTAMNLPQLDYALIMEKFKAFKHYLSNLPDTLAFLQPFIDSVVLKAGEVAAQSLDLDSAKALASKITSVAGAMGNVVSEILWILLFYFIFNLYGRQLYTAVMRLLPLVKSSKRILYTEFSSTIAVVVYGSGFNMVLQGFAFGILMLFIPGYDALYLGVMAGILSIVPIVGSALVYLPVIGMELFEGHYINAAVIFLYSWVVMGIIIDNVLKILFIGRIKRTMGLHYSMGEMMVLFSMMAGISAFGFWGIIIGPAVVSLGIASLDVYRETIRQQSGHRTGERE